jgi:hypothetical protein
MPTQPWWRLLPVVSPGRRSDGELEGANNHGILVEPALVDRRGDGSAAGFGTSSLWPEMAGRVRAALSYGSAARQSPPASLSSRPERARTSGSRPRNSPARHWSSRTSRSMWSFSPGRRDRALLLNGAAVPKGAGCERPRWCADDSSRGYFTGTATAWRMLSSASSCTKATTERSLRAISGSELGNARSLL